MASLLMLLWFIFGLGLGVGSSWYQANAAEVCAPDENPYICTLLEARDELANKYTNAEAGRRVLLAEKKTLQAWWASYLTGLDEQRKQANAEAENKAARAFEAGKGNRR